MKLVSIIKKYGIYALNVIIQKTAISLKNKTRLTPDILKIIQN